MNIRRVETESSVWLFREDENLYVRLPLGEDPGKRTAVPYTGEWEKYLEVLEPGDASEAEGFANDFTDRLYVIRDVPHGSGRHRHTGVITYDSANERVEQAS